MRLLLKLVIITVLVHSRNVAGDFSSNTACGVGQWYDSTSSQCRFNCSALGEVYDTEIKDCVANVTSARSKNARPTCKTVTLLSGQYQVLDADQIYIPILNTTVNSNSVNATIDDIISFCYNFTDNFMTCRRWVLEAEEFELRENGLKMWVPDYEQLYDTGDFYVRKDGDTNIAVVCVRPGSYESHVESWVVSHVYGATWIISEICLVAAFVLCLALPQFNFMYHILPFYIVSLFFTYLMLLLRSYTGETASGICFFYAVGLQFFFLASFFWLNVLAFDIWRTLAKREWYLEMFSRNSHRLIGFSGYAFGIPFIIVVLTVLVDIYKLGSERLLPKFFNNCWFSDDISILAFFYGPVAVILLINLVFFILTVLGLKNNNKGLFPDSVEKKHLWRTALELGVMMGLCWVMEIVSWIASAYPRIWYFTDVINGLQGLFILIVILTKPKVFSTVRTWFRDHLPCC